jgi:hypothetical protein
MGFRFFKLLLLYALQAQLSQFIMAGPLSIKAIDICAQVSEPNDWQQES